MLIYTLPHAILNAADRFPDREAFKCGTRSLTYSEIATQMKQLAFLLHELGLKKGDRVGIYLNRSLETAIAIYGIMHAGGIYVPLDIKAPPARIRFLIKDCNINILISHPSQKRHLDKVLEETTELTSTIGLEAAKDISCISWDEVLNQPSDFHPPFRILEQDLAYIIYTSGSTGVPKGIMHTHYSGLSYARLTADLYQLNENDRIGNHAPIHFDISTLGYFTAPLVGACTVIATDAHTILPASMSSMIENEKLTVWYSVPLALIQMLEKGLLGQRDMHSLRWVLYAGEAFPTRQLKSLMQLWPTSKFSNVYGPAEVNQCTFYHLSSPPDNDDPIPIGEVWGNTERLIINEQDEEVPDGTVGELLIRSATMMRGYWQQPELTARSLYKRENSTGVPEIFYRTGDLVKLGTDGILHFLGRKDNQIKIRGYRVELDAVEVQLLAHPAVLEAAVFAFPQADGNNVIEAAVSLKEGLETTEAELVNFIKNNLPYYAIPQQIKIVDIFPRTVNGKIDKAALISGVYSTVSTGAKSE